MNPKRNRLKFIQFKQSALTAGEYKLGVDLNVSYEKEPFNTVEDILDAIKQGRITFSGTLIEKKGDTPPEIAPLESFRNSLRFAVTGKRLKLGDSDVHALYPPPNSLGDFSDTIPYLVLNDSSLAWTRKTSIKDNQKAVPFLWLMVVSESEKRGAFTNQAQDAPQVLPVRTLKWGDLSYSSGDEPIRHKSETLYLESLQNSFLEKVLPDGIQVTPEKEGDLAPRFFFHQLKREKSTETETELVRCVDVKKKLLGRILPSYGELFFLAHNRLLHDENDNPISKERTAILSNRILDNKREKTRYSAYLVTLENRYHEAVFDFAEAEDDDYIRLNVLKNWDFTHERKGKTFVDRVKALNTSTLDHTLGAGSLSVTEPIKGVPLQHQLRQGGKTFSWYHGPLLSAKNGLATNFAHMNVRCADELVCFDERHAMLDISHATAWQLGRMLSLQNQQFASKLLRWKVDNYKQLAQETHDSLYSHLFCKQVDSDVADGMTDVVGVDDFEDLPNPAYLFGLLKIRGIIDQTQRVTEGIDIEREVEKLKFGLGEKDSEVQTEIISILKKHNFWTPYHWLESLALLQGIPLHYLIPNENMLPLESIKFFFLDWFWVESLLEGAFSIADSMNPAAKTDLEANTAIDIKDITGIILRSKLVADFPELKFEASELSVENQKDISSKQQLEILRNERINEDTRLILFRGRARLIDLFLTPDGLHYQLAENTQFKNEDGGEIEGKSFGKIPLKENPCSILDVAKTAERFMNNTGKNGDTPQSNPMTSAQFGMQLMRGNTKIRFKINTNGMEINHVNG